jgi:hypothetical protein
LFLNNEERYILHVNSFIFTSKEVSLCLLVIENESRLTEAVDRAWFACWRQSSILDNCCSNDGKWKSVERSHTEANSKIEFYFLIILPTINQPSLISAVVNRIRFGTRRIRPQSELE